MAIYMCISFYIFVPFFPLQRYGVIFLKIKMCFCHYLTHHSFEKCVLYFEKIQPGTFCLRFYHNRWEKMYTSCSVGSGKKNKKSLMSSGDIYQGHGSMSNTNSKMMGLGSWLKIYLISGMLLKSEVMLTFKCINWTQYPI